MENIEFTIQEKSKRGRKKKYATPEEARKAKLAQTKASNMKKKQSKKKSKKGGRIPPPEQEDPNTDDDPAYADEPPPPPPMRTADVVSLNRILQQDNLTETDIGDYLDLVRRFDGNIRERYEEFFDRLGRVYQITARTPERQQLEDLERTQQWGLTRIDLLDQLVVRMSEAIRRERAREETAREDMEREDRGAGFGGAVWRGATDPVFLEHYLKMKAEADKSGAGIFDYVKGFYDYAKRQIGSQVADTIDFVKDPIGATKRKADKRQEYIKAVIFGASKLPPKAREILAQYGDTPITEIMVARNPVGSLLTGALNAVSLGDFKKKFKKLPYDKLYHLYMWLKVGDQNITLEKNEVITMDIDASIRAGSDTMKVPIPAGLTLNVMLANTEKEMGGKFLKYSAYNNNCQDFIMAVLKSNGLGDDAIYSFVKQDTKSLFSDNSFLRKVSNTITDIGARVNTAIFGAGSKKGGMMAGEETPPPQNAEENNTIGQFTLRLLNMRNSRLINLNRLMREGLLQNFQLTIPELRNIFENWLGGAYNPQEIARFMTRFDRIANATSNYVGENSDDSDMGGYGIKKPIKKDLAKIKSAVKEKTMPNKWITFVKDYASSNGMSYRDALKDPNCKAQYKSGAGFFEDIADGIKAVFGSGMPTNADAYVADAYDATQLGANAGKRKSK